MPIRTESIELDISSCCSCAGPVCARQGDEGMVLKVTVLDSGEAMDLTGLTATLEYNNPALVQVTGTVSGAVASFELPSAALSGAGTWHPYVRLSQGDSDVASTGSFVLRVARAADLSAQQAEGYVPQLDEALSTATAASEAAQQAATQAAQAVEDAHQAVTDAQGAVSAANSAAASANAAASAASDAAAAARGNVLAGSETGRVVSVDDAYAAKPREVRVKGRTVNNLWRNPTGTSNGVTATETDDGALQVSGTASAYVALDLTTYAMQAGKTYRLVTDKSLPSGAGFHVRRYLGTTWVGDSANTSTSGSDITFALPSSDGTWDTIRLALVINSGTTVSGTYRVMLTEGSSAPDCFVAPGLRSVGECAIEIGTQESDPSASSTPVDLDGRELRSLPDGTADELVIGADGSCEVEQALEHVQYDGSTDEAWRLSTADNGNGIANFAINRADALAIGSADNALCDTLPIDTALQSAATSRGVMVADGTIYIRTISSEVSTVDGLRAWLADNPTSIVYRLNDAPQDITLDAVTLPSLPAPDATVWADAGAIPTDVGLDYERDISIAFAQLEAEVAALKVTKATQ